MLASQGNLLLIGLAPKSWMTKAILGSVADIAVFVCDGFSIGDFALEPLKKQQGICTSFFP